MVIQQVKVNMSVRTSLRTSLFAAVGAILAAMQAAPLSAETLVDVVQETLSTNPELGAIRFNRKAIDHELTAARGLQLPTVDVRSDIGRHRDYSRTNTGIITGGDYHTHEGVQGVISQRLFDGFEAWSEIERQKNRVESARWRVMDTANSVALRAAQAFFELQRARAVLKSAKSNLSAHRGLLDRVRSRVDGGRGVSSDLFEAQSRFAQAEALVVESEGRLMDADALFRSVVGRGPGNLQPAGPPSVGRPRSIENAVKEAIEFSPSVLATERDVAAADAAVDSARSRIMPRLNLELSTDRAWNAVEYGDRSIDVRAMLVVKWNLFNGGLDKARIWEAKSRSLEAAEISANTRRIVERETRTSWNAIDSASGRVPLLRRQVDKTRATREAYISQFDTGSRRLLDLLNVQSELFVAEATLRNEEFVKIYNSYRLLAAMGVLVPALGLQPPPEAALSHAPTIVDGWRDGWESTRQSSPSRASHDWSRATEVVRVK